MRSPFDEDEGWLAELDEGLEALEERFDALAKGLAQTVTRGEALRRIGGFLAGGALLALGGGPALAALNPKACRKFCRKSYPGQSRRARKNRRFCRFVCRQCQKTGRKPCLFFKSGPQASPVTYCSCGDDCCPRNRCCGHGVEEFCCAEGKTCCPGTDLCCPQGRCCQTGAGLDPECCPKGTVCCPGDVSRDCCSPDEFCYQGVCRESCPPDLKPCPQQEAGSRRDECCLPHELCTDSGCNCPSGQECGGRCCAPGETCRDGVCSSCPPEATPCEVPYQGRTVVYCCGVGPYEAFPVCCPVLEDPGATYGGCVPANHRCCPNGYFCHETACCVPIGGPPYYGCGACE